VTNGLEFGRWFLPGPAEVHPDVLAAMNRPMIAHRGPAMEQLMAELKQPLADIFRTANPVVIGTTSTTGFMEAAIRCGVTERVLVVIGGAFGERFAQIAEHSGKEVVRVMVPPGRTLEPEYLIQFLDGPPVDAIALVHSETSTGALAPLAEIVSVVRNRKDMVVLVDAASSLGGSPVETDQWGIDFVFAGSQKALGLPPGLALGAVSPRLLERARRLPDRGRYFDLPRYVEAAGRNQPPSTPAIPLYFALAAQVARIKAAGGVEARWGRHHAMLTMVEDWASGHPMVSLLPGPGRRSWTVSCLKLPASASGDQVVRSMLELGWVIGAGYGELRNNTVRIGHMGDAEPDMLRALLEDLAKVLGTKD
jgi:predicted phosphoserine aminotransferase